MAQKPPFARTAAFGLVVLTSLAGCGKEQEASESPFKSEAVSSEQPAAPAATEGKCGEGKCGEGKGGADKATGSEGKCGEGKCGADKAGSAEGKCGGDK